MAELRIVLMEGGGVRGVSRVRGRVEKRKWLDI